jgi:hypothetical protein
VYAGVWFATLRLKRRRGHFALVVGGIAIAAGALGAVHAMSIAAQDRSLGQDLARLQPDDRSVRVSSGGIPIQTGVPYAELDELAREQLGRLGLGTPDSVMLMNEISFSGTTISLAAMDDLSRWIRLDEGRLPDRCRPTRCEVVQIAGTGRLPRIAGLRLVRVGRGTIASRLPLADVLDRYSSTDALRAAASYHTAGPIPFLMTGHVRDLAGIPAIADVRRTYSWFVPLAEDSLHPWSADAFLTELARVRSALRTGVQPYEVTSPDVAIESAVERGRISAQRLLLLGGTTGALLLAFVVLAASAHIRDLEAARRRLRWLGGRGWQLGVLEATEALAVAFVGALVGWTLAHGLAAIAAAELGAPVLDTLQHSTLSLAGVGIALALAFGAWCVLLVARSLPSFTVGVVTVTLADMAALGALGAIVVGVARGAADPSTLREGGTGGFLMLLPGLVTFVLAVAFARLLRPALRLLERVGRSAPLPLRLAALSLVRAPGRPAIAIGFLIASGSLAVFVSSYRTILIHAQSDAAAYAVPSDAVVRADTSRLVRVLDAAEPADYEALGEATPVTRLSASVPRLAGEGNPTVLGIPAKAIVSLDGWRSDFANTSLSELARRIGSRGSVALRGTRLPEGGATLAVPVQLRGQAVKLGASIESRRGFFEFLKLGIVEPGSKVIRARLPQRARGGLLVGLRLDIARGYRIANAGVGPQPDARGTLALGDLSVDGVSLGVDYRNWLGVDGVRASGGRDRARLDYLLGPELISRFRPRQPTDGMSLPIVVSPNLAEAADGDALPLDVSGYRLQARVVGVAERFPTIRGDFVLADRDLLAVQLNTVSPGRAVPTEVWIDARPPGTARELADALDRRPFSQLDVTLRHERARDLRSDPLASGTLSALGGIALAALVLALVGVVILLVADARDERGELFDLLAQGAAPDDLRHHLQLRLVLLVPFGLTGALLGGAILSALAVSFVELSAGAEAPEPPIAFVLDWPLLLGGLALYLAVASALVAGLSARGVAAAGRIGRGVVAS